MSIISLIKALSEIAAGEDFSGSIGGGTGNGSGSGTGTGSRGSNGSEGKSSEWSFQSDSENRSPGERRVGGLWSSRIGEADYEAEGAGGESTAGSEGIGSLTGASSEGISSEGIHGSDRSEGPGSERLGSPAISVFTKTDDSDNAYTRTSSSSLPSGGYVSSVFRDISSGNIDSIAKGIIYSEILSRPVTLRHQPKYGSTNYNKPAHS